MKNPDIPDSSPLNWVLTVRECMEIFGLKQQKTVINACIIEKVVARKADTEVGARGGVWLIEYNSAYALWGNRIEKKGSNDDNHI